jgi:hypothetical protein
MIPHPQQQAHASHTPSFHVVTRSSSPVWAATLIHAYSREGIREEPQNLYPRGFQKQRFTPLQ